MVGQLVLMPENINVGVVILEQRNCPLPSHMQSLIKVENFIGLKIRLKCILAKVLAKEKLEST